jgi:hypothetical protein
MTKGYPYTALATCTAFFLIALWFLLPLALPSLGISIEDSTDEGKRNERSTPRSFILPATPAVAQLGENHLRMSDEDISDCLKKLEALGYNSDDTAPSLTAQNVEAILRYQDASRLKLTGQLDRDTVGLLGCS